jgi:hypothetical protein
VAEAWYIFSLKGFENALKPKFNKVFLASYWDYKANYKGLLFL